MARIYKLSDRIPVKIHDLEIEISPLSFEQKSVCQSLIMSGDHMKAAVYALQSCLKSVKGVENADGSPYELLMDGDKVKSECIDDLLNLSESTEMQYVAMSLIQGIPKIFVDPITEKPIKGVSFVNSSGKKKRK